MHIAVIGTGYVGLVAGACFAHTGNTVICVDKNPEIVSKLARGFLTIYEPGLSGLIEQSLERSEKDPKPLTFTTNLPLAVQQSDIIFICVGTPMGADGSADLSAVRQVAAQIGNAMNGYKIIVNKSTVPVGTASMVRDIIKAYYPGDFDVVSNPEFLKEGSAVEDFLNPDRVVIGFDRASRNTLTIQKVFRKLYRPFTRTPLLFMQTESAELAKYGANALLATRISFMNELARVAESCGADINEIRVGIGSDARIGPHFLNAGPGYGGSCFPKDVSALARIGESVGVNMRVITATELANDEQRTYLYEKIKAHYKDNLTGKCIAVWGLAFKANTDDVRFSPSIELIQKLLGHRVTIRAYDPEAMPNARLILGDNATFAKDQYAALAGADALIIATDWDEFKNPDYAKLRELHDGLVIDARNIYDPLIMEREQLNYLSIGRQPVLQTSLVSTPEARVAASV